jgi:hypothetical protein
MIAASFSRLAIADQARPPYDYVKDVPGGKYVLVMLARQDVNPFDPGAPDDAGVVSQDGNIRSKWPQSGLYRAGSKAPLWTIPWYAFTVYPASDGKHLVRMGPWASSADQLAIAFYAKGEPIRTYLVRDLVRDTTRLRHTVSHFFWMAEHHYDDKARIFHLKTVDGIKYRFSVTTGEIIP